MRAKAGRVARASPASWRPQGQPMACDTGQIGQQHRNQVARVGAVVALPELGARQAAASAVH